MIQIDFELSAAWSTVETRILIAADEAALRYDVLLGDLVFVVNEVDFSTRWGWIPLLDLAYCLKRIADNLVTGESCGYFEFTESEAWLQFKRQRDGVEVAASYAAGTARVDFNEICDALTASSRAFVSKLRLQYPQLLQNDAFCKMAAVIDSPPTVKERVDSLPN